MAGRVPCIYEEGGTSDRREESTMIILKAILEKYGVTGFYWLWTTSVGGLLWS
jgi:hypothetical protein